jgi:hypothetical protein
VQLKHYSTYVFGFGDVLLSTHRYFGLQQYGECWSGKDAELTYARDGSSDACVKKVGKTGANFVYKFVNSLDQSE